MYEKVNVEDGIRKAINKVVSESNCLIMLSEITPNLMESQKLYDDISSFFVGGGVLTMKTLNDIIEKSNKSSDVQFNVYSEKLADHINKNKYRNTLLYVAENMLNTKASIYNRYNKALLNTIEEQLVLSESEIENGIVNGSFDMFANTNVVLSKMIKGIKESKLVKHASDSLYTESVPFSPTIKLENGNSVFMVGNRVYESDGSILKSASLKNDKLRMFEAFTKGKYDYNKGGYVFMTILGECLLPIGENKGCIMVGSDKMSRNEYIRKASQKESISSLRGIRYDNDSILLALEHIDLVKEVSNVRLVENKTNREVHCFMRGDGMYNVVTVQSPRITESIYNFKNPVDSAKYFNKITLGYDITKYIAEDITNNNKVIDENMKSITEINGMLNKITESMEVVKSMLTKLDNDKGDNKEIIEELLESYNDLQATYNETKKLLSDYV